MNKIRESIILLLSRSIERLIIPYLMSFKGCFLLLMLELATTKMHKIICRRYRDKRCTMEYVRKDFKVDKSKDLGTSR